MVSLGAVFSCRLASPGETSRVGCVSAVDRMGLTDVLARRYTASLVAQSWRWSTP